MAEILQIFRGRYWSIPAMENLQSDKLTVLLRTLKLFFYDDL